MIRRIGQACAFLAFVCSLVLKPAAATAQTTALFFDSQPGDYIGGGVSRTFAPPEATITASRVGGTGVAVSVVGPSSVYWWYLNFSAGQNAPLVPGSYFGATRQPFTQFTGLDVYGSGRGCNQLTGRFVVLEAEYAPDGTVLRFAADFEQHCEDANAALFGAVRVNSTISAMSPFGGNYPDYRLTITPPINGIVIGTGLACGDGETACEVTYPAVNLTGLTATPDPGFIFTGWTGACYGGADASVHVNTVVRCGASFGPQVPAGPRTLLFWDSLPGDYVGQGERHVLSSANSTWSVSLWGSGFDFAIRGRRGAEDLRLSLQIQPPTGAALSPGLEVPVALNPSLGTAGVCISANSHYCSTLSGKIHILDVSLAPDGTPLRFAADIEQHAGAGKPGLFVAIRYNSEVEHTVPFFGAYPEFALSITPPANGRVTGSQGISCGSGANSCHLTSPSSTSVTLSATPDAGFAFGGWTGACLSATVDITVAVDSDKVCSAVFVPIVPTTPRTLAVIESQTGDFIGGGTKRVFSEANSVWRVAQYTGRNSVEFAIDSVDGRGGSSWWRLYLKAPEGQILAPGVYAPATRGAFTSGAGLDLSGDSHGCNRLSGRFVVLEIAYGQDGVLNRFAADAEQHCEDAGPGMFVAIRYNSLTPGVAPFAGDFPKYQLTLTPPVHGRIAGPGLACGWNQSACSAVYGAPTTIALTAIPDVGYIFTGWTGACRGPAATTVKLNMAKSCGATFGPARPNAPTTLLYWESAAGDYIGAGKTHVFSPENSRWTVAASDGGGTIQVGLRSFDDDQEAWWTLSFRAPAGGRLAPGTYTVEPPFDPADAGLNVYGDGRGCGNNFGTFTIHEVTISGEAVVNFAVDFEQRCSIATAPPLRGRLRFNSTRPIIFRRRPGNFDGDGRAGTMVFRPSSGVWYHRSASGNAWALPWGDGLDVPAPGDYDGDGRTDITVFRPASGAWYSILSRTGAATGRLFGTGTDIPVPGDYDGDGRDDLALFSPSTGTWSQLRSSLGSTSVQWGLAQDRTVPADYDGDGRTDVAVFRPSTGVWYILNSRTGTASGVQWGTADDVAVPADYDGDGRADVAVFRPADGTWFIISSFTGAATGVRWGSGEDVPVPADYDGDGRADIAVFRPSTGIWYIVASGTGTALGIQWGSAGDIPAR